MPVHRCAHCTREFVRHEHLVRHERTHTKEKPYKCSLCKQAYARRDLLKRHEIRTHNHHRRPSRNENSQPTPPTQHAPSTNLRQQLSQDYSTGNNNDCLVNMPASAMDLPLEIGTDSSLSIQEYLLPDSMHWLETLNNGDSNYNSLYNFGVFDAFESPDSDQTSLPPVPIDPSMAQSRSILSHPGSPLLQSTPNHRTTGSSTGERNLDMSEVYWDVMQPAVANWSPFFALPKRTSLSRFIRRYFGSFHRHQPLLHEPTWSPNNSSLPLVLAVCANGALYSLERTAAMEMHRIATDMLDPTDENLSTLQTMMLLGAFSAWCDPVAHFDTALKLHGQMTIAVRKAWAAAATLDQDGQPDDTLEWKRWLTRESRKRATYCVFTLLNLMTIGFNIPSPILLEPQYGLPAHESQWNSGTENEWLQAKSLVPVQEWRSADAVLERLGDESLPVPSNIGMFGCHVLISLLTQKIILFRKSCSAGVPIFYDVRNYFLRLLRRWQVMWENEPESTLSPENPHGPILFNCTAILRVAYIRLVSDYSAVREAFSVSSEEQVARTLEMMELPRREPETTRAVLQACLALRIPAQLGFKVVARTSFWVWSVQHALSYFECAIFLSKWCQGAANVDDLSDDERGVMNLVEQIIGASGGEQAVGEYPAPLHVVVLQRWAELLDTGDTTVWQVQPRMARALRTYAHRLMEN